MLVGILPPYRSGIASDAESMVRFARHAEACGFESIYTVEHVVVAAGYTTRYPYSDTGRMPLPEDCELPDPLELLAYLAASTTTLRLGTGVLIGPHHHPLVLAKRLATLDRLSGGRLQAGLGVGWMREELEATGVDPSTRGRRLDDLIPAMRAVWRDEVATHHGDFFRFDDVRSHPKPAQRCGGVAGVPIHIGGHSRAAAQRAGRLGDGYQPIGLAPDLLAVRLAEMRSAADGAGRDPASIEVTLGCALGDLTIERIEALRRAGAHRVLVGTGGEDLGALLDSMARGADAVGLSAPDSGGGGR